MKVQWKNKDDQTIAGRSMEGAFAEWAKKESQAHNLEDYGKSWGMVDLLTRWMVETPTGALALERLNRFPKQRRLPLPDDSCPWEVVE